MNPPMTVFSRFQAQSSYVISQSCSLLSQRCWIIRYSSISLVAFGMVLLYITPTGRCLAVFVQTAEIVGCLTPVFSESCIWVISFMASKTFKRNFYKNHPLSICDYSTIIEIIQYDFRIEYPTVR